MISKSKIKQIKLLQLKKNRDEAGLFFVEGVKPILELLAQKPQQVEEVFATSDFVESYLALIKSSKCKLTEVDDKELIQISNQNTPNQVLALCKYFNGAEINFDFDKNFTLYLDDIRDPGNFGTIIRLADWFGISEVFCSHNSCDSYNPKVIQSTMGAFLRVNINYLSLEDLIQKNKIKHVYGALLNGENLYTQKLNPGLIVVGNEASGISSQNLKFINKAITIPGSSQHKSESLNAAMAASIITAEFFRQGSGF